MTCAQARKLLPLHVGGDLPRRRAAALEHHLGGCEACRQAAAELARDLAAFRETERLAVPPLPSVRNAVVREIERRATPSPFGAELRLAVALAAVVALIAVAVLIPPTRRAPGVAVPVAAAPTPAPVAVAPVVVRAAAEPSVASAPVFRRARAASPAAPGSGRAASARLRPEGGSGERPMKITLLTDDPEVVIYWLVEPKKENRNG